MKKYSFTIMRGRILSCIFVSLILAVSACKKEPKIVLEKEDYAKVNHWVTDEMRFWYYWNEEMPGDGSLDFNLYPEDFFEEILNKNDRFSWIDKAEKLKEDLSGVSTTTGLNFGLVQNDNVIYGFVRYVIPGSPADKAGIERGMFFSKVNGKTMSQANYNSVLDPYFNGEGFEITLAKLEGNQFIDTESINLSSVKINEPAVYLYKTITTPNGTKVGYLFYNRFLADTKEKSYSDELLEAFHYFKSEGIQDLVLDMRYNLGGSISVSGLLSALIMENYDADDVFVEYRYNDLINAMLSKEDRRFSFADVFDTQWLPRVPGANLNLPKVYILATYNSASASELVINNLKPYMEVIHIGETTRGKNEGSRTIEDESGEIEWAIQPIILKLANANHFGDYDHGLSPDILVKEGYELKPLGDLQDPLLSRALQQIDPTVLSSIRARPTPPRVMNLLQSLRGFDEVNYKAKPVLVDETVKMDHLMKIK